jgi:alkylhydroperoxidase family enzyme
MEEVPRMARLPLVTRKDIPESLHYVWDRITADGKTPNIFGAMGNNPELLRSYLRLGNGLWANCGLDLPTRELVILRNAILRHSIYEWHQHVRIGRSAGLSDERIVALHHWRESGLFSESEKALLGWVDALGASDHPPADAYDALALRFDQGTIVGVTLLSAFYAMTAAFLGSMEVETEEPFVGWELQG